MNFETPRTLKGILDGLPAGIYARECERAHVGRVVYWSPGCERVFGIASSEAIGKHLCDLAATEAARVFDEADRVALAAGIPTEGAAPHLVEEGRECNVSRFLLADDEGRPRYLVVVVEDVTEERESERHMRESEQQVRLALEGAGDCLWDLNLQNRTLVVSPGYFAMLGYDPSEVHDVWAWASERSCARSSRRARKLLEALSLDEQVDFEYRLKHRNGHWVWINSRARATEVDEQGRPVRILGINRDVTAMRTRESRIRRQAQQIRKHAETLKAKAAELERANQELRMLASTDPLTGLANRSAFQERLELACATGTGWVAVSFIDIDSFKLINDTLGHQAGDLVLKEVAKRLDGACGKGELLARFAGDEFILLQCGLRWPEEAVSRTRAVADSLSHPIKIEGRTVLITPRTGIAVAAVGASDPDTLMKNADLAMHYALQQRMHHPCVFQEWMAVATEKRFLLATDLRLAIDRGELRLVYQPFVDLRTGDVVGAEALIRWDHPTRGSIPPMDFIPLAEESGLIHEIGAWTLVEACGALSGWRQTGRCDAGFWMSINLSGLQLQDPQIAAKVRDVLDKTSLPASCLVLEVTETALVTDASGARDRLTALRNLGVKVAMDDFGTGYSSMGSLSTLPLDKVKIDKSFLEHMGEDLSSTAIVRALVTLCQVLGLTIVGEGVENEDQLVQLQTLGCHYGQGYFFSKPVPEEELLEFIARCCDTRRAA